MKKLALILLLCLGSIVINAQQPPAWHGPADKYLQTIRQGDPAFETPDNLDALRQALASEFKKGKLDDGLVHWLALYSVIANGNDVNNKSYYQEALRRYEYNPYRRALFIMGYSKFNSGARENAEMIRVALSAFEEAKKDNSLIYLQALVDYADALTSSRQFGEAIRQLEKVRALAESRGMMKQEIYYHILSSFNFYFNSIGDTENAVKYSEMSDHLEMDYLGTNQLYQVVFDEALPYFTTSPLNSALADQCRIAALFQYSPTEVYSSDLFIYQKAVAADEYEKVVKGLSVLPNEQTNYAVALFNKGVMDLEVHNATAAEFLSKAATFYNKSGLEKNNLSTVLNSANYLTCAYVQQKDYSAAVKVFEHIETVLKNFRLDLYKWYAKIYHNMILTYDLAGDREKVMRLLQPYYSETYNSEYNSAYHQTKYGDITFSYGAYEKALVHYRHAHMEHWHEAEMRYNRRDKMMDDEGNEIPLIDEENTIVDIGATESGYVIHKYKPTGEFYTRLLYKLAQVAFLNHKFVDARTYTLDYINEFYTKINFTHTNLNRGTDLHEIYRLKQELFPAYDLFQNIIMSDSTWSAEYIADNNAHAYTHILDSKANIQYEYRHMLSIIENSTDESLKQALAKYNSHRNKLAQLKLSGTPNNDEIESLKISIDTLKAYMSHKTALTLFEDPMKRFVYWSDVKSSLKRNEAAIEIRRFPKYDSGHFTNEIMYAAYVITPISSYPQVVFMKNGNYLEGRGFKKYKNSIMQKLDDNSSYNDYWKPIQHLLPGIWKAYLSSDGVYSQINVNTLSNPETKKFLPEELTVYNVISTKGLKEIKDYPPTIKSATLMGRPAYYLDDPKLLNGKNTFEDDAHRTITRAQITSGNITDLPGTEKEIQNIAKILKTKRVETTYFIGKNSTEEAFKQSTGDILHIATHGFWFKEDNLLENTDAMFNSGLLLAGVKNYYEGNNIAGDEDGILTAYEVQGMNLNNTKLVVLSACETAAGHVEAGEGVFGLQRAFSIAGSDKLIMSLWKVDDTATQQLFTDFYANWVNGSLTISEAFQKAQESIRQKYKHPYYWGAFVLVD
jgi:hypothetical protein